MKRFLPYLFATAISVVAIFSSFTLADPELGISTALVSWMACIWIISNDRKNRRCLS
jgi:membrane associated rhomboid family serine protease